MKIISYKGKQYPKFQDEGNASQFAIPFAKHICNGVGYDIGCMKIEWAFPCAIPIDLNFNDDWDANNLPITEGVDYIFSSHCLEHIDNWVETMDYWFNNLKCGGNLFLYLPHYDQEYWRPWNNKKHRNMFTPQILKDYLEQRGYDKIFVSERDLNHSFMVTAEKPFVDLMTIE